MPLESIVSKDSYEEMALEGAGMRIEPLMSFIVMQDELLKAQPGRLFFPETPPVS